LLAAQNQLLKEQLAQLQQTTDQLRRQFAELQARLDQTSSNSHKPPSSDPPWAKKPTPKKPSGKPRGVQKGHPGHCRKRLPPERVHKFVHYLPRHCQAKLPKQASPTDPPPSWHQVAELPPTTALITEFQAHSRTCSCCGKRTRASVPTEIRSHVIGPHLAAVMSYLAGRCHDGRRTVLELVEDCFGVPLSLGSVAQYETHTTAALAEAHAQALAAVRDSSAKYVDETGWKQAAKHHWLWTAATPSVACFAVQEGRGWDAAQMLLGERGGKGVICSDRHQAYASLGVDRRQVCWAHLDRDFVKWSEKSQKTRLLGDDGQAICRSVFGLWRDFRERKIDREQLQCALEPIQKRLRQILEWGQGCGDAGAGRFCRKLLKLGPALWTFARVEGVEPTNNLAERMLRSAVLWRKNSFGSFSEMGSRFVERMLTVVQTLRLQRRRVIAFLSDTIKAHRAKQPLPSLVAA
jgi:transposase